MACAGWARAFAEAIAQFLRARHHKRRAGRQTSGRTPPHRFPRCSLAAWCRSSSRLRGWAVSSRVLTVQTGPVAERVRVRELDDDEGRRLVRIVRRDSGSVVTWRRAQMVLLSAQGMDVAGIAKVAFTSEGRVRLGVAGNNAVPGRRRRVPVAIVPALLASQRCLVHMPRTRRWMPPRGRWVRSPRRPPPRRPRVCPPAPKSGPLPPRSAAGGVPRAITATTDSIRTHVADTGFLLPRAPLARPTAVNAHAAGPRRGRTIGAAASGRRCKESLAA
jgi:hypothetical protein